MNSVTICGNLVRDIENRYLPDGTAVGSFSVADNQGKDKPAIFWRCSLFGKRAESLSPYLTKGQQVTVVGSVTEREYQKDGQTVKVMEIRVNDVALQGGKRDAPSIQPHPASAKAKAAPAPAGGSGFDDMSDDVPW